VFIIAYSLSFSIIRLLALVCLEIAMHNEQFHSFVQFIHSFILPTRDNAYMPPLAYTRYCTIIPPPSFFFFYSFFFSLTCMRICALLSLKIFSKRIYIYIASAHIHTHTNIVTSTYVSIIFYHLFLVSIYLVLFMVLYTISFLLLLSIFHDR
jgi:hypothetical protein